jgi:hypothetical protein
LFFYLFIFFLLFLFFLLPRVMINNGWQTDEKVWIFLQCIRPDTRHANEAVGREGETKTKLLQEMKKDGGKGKRDGERMKIGVLERKRKAAEKWKRMEKKEEKIKERMR